MEGFVMLITLKIALPIALLFTALLAALPSQARDRPAIQLEVARSAPEVREINVLMNKLKLPRARAEAIIVGAAGKENVIKDLAAVRLGDSEFNCTSHGCSCHGIDDCNLMFTTVCSAPSTNGSCTGEVCVCTP
jgi:hypothetical protein